MSEAGEEEAGLSSDEVVEAELSGEEDVEGGVVVAVAFELGAEPEEEDVEEGADLGRCSAGDSASTGPGVDGMGSCGVGSGAVAPPAGGTAAPLGRV